MKLFLKTILQFTLISLAIFTCFFLLNLYLYKKYTPAITPEISTLFIGDSHFMRGINPNLVEKSVNISQPGEPYFINRIKSEFFLDQENNIEYIIVPFSHLNIAEQADLKFYNDEGTLDYMERYWPLIKDSDFREFQVDEHKYWKSFIRFSLLPNFKYVTYPFSIKKNKGILKTTFIGSYQPYDKDFVNNLDSRIAEHFNANANAGPKSWQELIELIKLCKAKSKTAVLVKMPVTDEYYSKIPSELITFRDSLETELKGMGVKILDYERYFHDKHYFHDSDHLNSLGADSISKLINQSIK